ncbi:hypothetical protein [Spirosoma sp. 209]|uniref:hypothetical protein n=1 Tax=Spirosoma sp. 209 TaxID=1955701 RepID=UPI001F175D36|nr:hypothetical protein [Spirosoma sp. 209]
MISNQPSGGLNRVESSPRTESLRPQRPHPERPHPKSFRPRSWTQTQKIAFRIAFIFFLAMSLPNNLSWYRDVLALDWTNLHYRDVYDIARFGSGLTFFGNTLFGSSLLGYAPWIITLLVACAGGLVWTALVRLRKADPADYNLLYYWLRVVVRYRAGIGIIGFGFTKLLPTQLPYPSLGLMNTNFGDLTGQKLYWLSIGIVPWYEVFTGVVEVVAGALLFFRKTTFLGAALLFGALADIVYVNLAYDGGVHVYSSYFVLLSAFLLWYDVPFAWNLFVRERFTVPVYHYPDLSKAWQRWTRYGLKAITLFLFIGVLFYLQVVNFIYDPYKQPAQRGIRALRGNYAVTEFRLNGQPIPYSLTDSTRWQEATFENWSTLTFKVNRPARLDLSNGGGAPMRDLNRTFEVTGVAGGQRVFYYDADTLNQTLYLQDKVRLNGPRDDAPGAGNPGESGTRRKERAKNPNAISEKQWIPAPARATIGDEFTKVHPLVQTTRRRRGLVEESKPAERKRMILRYQTTDGQRVVLTGIDERKDSIYVVLDRITRPYALTESTLKAGRYD